MNFLALQGGFLASNLYALTSSGDNALPSWAFGASAGLIASEFLSPTWKPDLNTLFLGLLYGIEGGVAASTLSDLTSNEEALSGLGFSTGVALAIAQDSLFKVESHNVITSAFGAYTGHLLGLGITGVLENTFEPNTQLTSFGGVAGTVLGAYWAKKKEKIDPIYLVSSGFLLGVQGLGIGSAVLINDENSEENIPEVLGFTSLLVAGGNVGSIFLQEQLGLTGDKAAFLTSTSLWGTYIGNVGAIALDLDVDPSAVPLTQLAFFDMGLAGGALLLMDQDFDPRSSINTQLYAALGGTLGAYMGFLINDTTDAQSAAFGSLLGVALGGVYGARVKKKISFRPSLPFLEQTVFSAMPKFSDEGQIGVQINIAGLLGTPKTSSYSY